MTDIDYSRMTTEELLKRFAEGAQKLGAFYTTASENDPQSPEALLVDEMLAVAEELRARKPITALRRLFTADSPDIRRWAAGQFLGTDPEWASATFDGLFEGITTEEAMALRERAEKLPPDRPTAQEMSTDELVARFEDAAIRRIGAQFICEDNGLPDTNVRNRIMWETASIVKELKAREALPRILPLLAHEKQMVRYVTALHCLPIASAQAVPIIEAMAATHDPIESRHAARALERWRSESSRPM